MSVFQGCYTAFLNRNLAHVVLLKKKQLQHLSVVSCFLQCMCTYTIQLYMQDNYYIETTELSINIKIEKMYKLRKKVWLYVEDKSQLS